VILTSGELLGCVITTPLNFRKHTEEASLDRDSRHRDSSVVGLIPRVIIFSQEPRLRLARNHGCLFYKMLGELRLGNNIADPPHNKETVLDRRIKEVLDVVAIAQVASMAPRNALGGSNVCLVTSGAGGLGHRELIDTWHVPEAMVDIASLGIRERVAEVVGRGQEHVPLGSAEELLVAREVPGVDLFAADKVEVGDVIRDNVGGVGSGHGD